MQSRANLQPERSPGASGRKRAGWLLLVVILLGGCQSNPVSRAEKENIRRAMTGYQQSINKRSYAEVSPYLAPNVQIGHFSPEMSVAGLKAGMHWTPYKVSEVQLLSARKIPDGVEARVAFYSRGMVMTLKMGFDEQGKIRTIENDPRWKEPKASLPAVFTTDFVVRGGLIFVQGTVNGTAGYLLFDTGASTLLLNRKYFRPTSENGMAGIAGSIHGIRKRLGSAEVSSLRWGGLQVRGISGELHDFSQIEKTGVSPLLGAISYNEVKDSAVAIDWPRQKIQVFATNADGSKKANISEPPPRVRLPFSYYTYLPMVKGRVGGQTYSLLFDSGAEACVLPNKAGLGSHFRPAGLIRLSDGSSRTNATGLAGVINELHLGDVVFKDVPVAIFSVPNLPNKGFLSPSILRNHRFEVNFRAREFAIWP